MKGEKFVEGMESSYCLPTRDKIEKVWSSSTKIYTKTPVLGVERWTDFLLIC